MLYHMWYVLFINVFMGVCVVAALVCIVLVATLRSAQAQVVGML